MPIKNFHWKNLPAASLQHSDQLASDWDRLNAAQRDLPFMAARAIVSTLSVFGDGTERLLIAHEGNTVRAMFVLRAQGRFRWQTFQPSQLPLGAWVSEPQVQLLDVARDMLRGPLGLCLTLSITQVDPHIAPRASDAPDCEHHDYIDTGWIDVQGSFEEYWNARGKNLRQNMRKQRAKLLTDGVKLTMRVLRDHADMAPAIARYGKLESGGWKAQEGTAIHPDNAQGRFYRELLEQASLQNEAVVYEYLFDERTVAMNLCLERDETLVVLKTTYEESIKSFSPAFLLRESELQEIYKQDKIKHIEYFGRLMDWHTKLTEQKRTIYHLTIFRWPFLKRLNEARRRKASANIQATSADISAAAKATPS